jgi:hypothetical protein
LIVFMEYHEDAESRPLFSKAKRLWTEPGVR